MNRIRLAALLVLGACSAPGQEKAVTLDDLMESADQWAKENLDDDALAALRSVDREKVRQFFKELEKQFHGDYVIDLAALKDGARSVLPLLEGYEETAPYAAWLKTRLDYLDVADQLRLTIPPPKPEPGRPRKPVPNPLPQKQREVWITKLAQQPWPKAAKEYVPRLKPIFATAKVPPELVWIAEVESSFDPRARSPEGGVGLFQLRPATARRYGLRTGLLDQRLKPEASARAAAQCLRYLRDHFKDWRLVLAAYNSGEGTVEKMLKRHKAHTFDAIATHLPAETQMFVPRVEAVLLKREGARLSRL